MLRESFFATVGKYSSDEELNSRLWREVELNYGKSNRHYHTLVHLNNLFSELINFKDKFTDWDSVIFAVVYHDIIYNTLKSNNEEKSAVFAATILTKLEVPRTTILLCEKFILATKRHESVDLETDLFTDADLSVLGLNADSYKSYAAQIRKEYSIYPDIMYNPGRVKVLQHFLDKDSVYKTPEFTSRYEENARANLLAELKSLRG